jgi:hypothetical protein
MRSLDVIGLYRLWSMMQSSYTLPWYSIMRNILDVRSEAFGKHDYKESIVVWLQDYCRHARDDERGGQHQTGWLTIPAAATN